jgi:hypothetical protein
MGGRVVEGTGLENRQARKRLEGSNPSPSASYRYNILIAQNNPSYNEASHPFCPQIVNQPSAP